VGVSGAVKEGEGLGVRDGKGFPVGVEGASVGAKQLTVIKGRQKIIKRNSQDIE
jgi:hypothetical protein